MNYPGPTTPSTAPAAPPAAATAVPGLAAPRAAQFAPLWDEDLQQAAQVEEAWLWRGYLAPGGITLLTSQWKAGKTTLIALLLSRLRDGGELAGLPVRPARVAVVTEESPQQWYRRSQKLHFGGHVC